MDCPKYAGKQISGAFYCVACCGKFFRNCVEFGTTFKTVAEKVGLGEFAKGLSTAILLFCIGTLSILGPIESALHGNHTYLFTNAALDFVTSMVLASTYGIGIGLAAPVLFLWQGAIYINAGLYRAF